MRERRPPERLAAWFVTGPVGHLVAGVTDLCALLLALRRARREGGA